MRNKRKVVILALLVFITVFMLQSDDKELFMGENFGNALVKPNVIILMDSSGSMNTIVFYPKIGLDGIEGNADDGYDSYINYEGTMEGFDSGDIGYWSTDSTRWYARWISGTNAYEDNSWTGVYNKDGEDRLLCGSTGQANLEVGDWIINRNGTAVAQIKTKTDCTPVASECGAWLELENRVGTFPLGSSGDDNCLEIRSGAECRPVLLYGTLDHDHPVRYDHNYLKWIYLHATPAQREAVTHFSTYGTFDVTDFSVDIPSPCVTPGHDRILTRFTRIQVIREVACKIAEEALEIVQLGLFRFDQSFGGYLQEGLVDASEVASGLVDYKNKVYTIEGDAMTPLAEALADVWYYYRPGNNPAYWPVNMDTATTPVSNIDYYCQNNYAIILTDGESTMDEFSGDTRFDDSVFKAYNPKRNEPWNDWSDGWGDPDNNDVTEGMPTDYDPANSIYCPNWTCWKREISDGNDLHGTDYLDDVAYFMANSDLFPEESLPLGESKTVYPLYTD